MQLNTVFLENIRTIYKESGQFWLDTLPTKIEQLALEWQFRFVKPLPDLSYSFVGLVRRDTTGQTAILKIAPAAQDLPRGLRWLKAFHNVVPVIFEQDEVHNAVLMEHLEPGYTLKKLVNAGEDDRASKVICSVIRDLQSQKTSDPSFPHIATLAHSFAVLKGRFDEALRTKALTLFEELTRDRTHDVLLHGDLHHDNILRAGDTWKAIDPHGLLGDPAAEAAAMIRNPYDGFPRDKPLIRVFERRLHMLAEDLPFDRERIKAWCFCITVLSAAWTFEGYGKVTDSEKEFASALDRAKI